MIKNCSQSAHAFTMTGSKFPLEVELDYSESDNDSESGSESVGVPENGEVYLFPNAEIQSDSESMDAPIYEEKYLLLD